MKTIVMVVVVVVVVVTDAASNSWQNNTERSIVYVKGFPAAGGDLIIAPDTSVAPEDAFAIFNTTRRCACRVACFSIAACQMVAAVSREDTGKEWIECRLIAVRYLSTMPHLQDDRAAVLFLWPTTFPHFHRYEVLNDRLLYLVMEGTARFTTAKRICECIPGHRLPMLKTQEQYEAFNDLTSTIGKFWSLVLLFLSYVRGSLAKGNKKKMEKKAH
ncbi:uncharacterized protein LOC135089502 isoform X1 [Scylla paramamosain]|uniref:uncharacterized protein LOC135089502 isoform X1 n=1 Tax=Scylla paramamosain TaxID=85552 RepID=UPI003082D8CA